jgi:bifunctional DNase/RNase
MIMGGGGAGPGALIALAFVALTAATTPGDRVQVAPPRMEGAQEADVVALVVDDATHQPTLVLQGKRDGRRLAMAIGLAEATEIAFPLQGITPPRPLTHDLFLTLFGRLKVKVVRVMITDVKDGVYYATIVLSTSGGELALDARPSDAIALAVRAKVPVIVDDRILDAVHAPVVAPRGHI